MIAGPIIVLCAYLYATSGRDALARIIERDCHLGSRTSLPNSPCERVDLNDGYVILKDRKGASHYLLLPTIHLAGIESPELLTNAVPNYFELAWTQRAILAQSYRQRVRDEMVMLAINSTRGRSQDLLHIHIACMRQDVRRVLDQVENWLDTSWAPVPIKLREHAYWMRRVTPEQMQQTTPFQLLAEGLPDADAGGIDGFSLAMTATRGGFLLLATRRDLWELNFGSAGELQDYDCQ
jgi:CDP-diacylglycerol pyrophosphatase